MEFHSAKEVQETHSNYSINKRMKDKRQNKEKAKEISLANNQSQVPITQKSIPNKTTSLLTHTFELKIIWYV